MVENQHGTAQWYALSVKPNQERLAEFNLKRLGLETLCPLLKQEKVIRRQRKTVVGPLFPGYIFARFSLTRYYRAVTYARGVKHIVTFGLTPAVVDDQLIEELKGRLENGCLVCVRHELRPGQVVRIKHGPLGGLEAVFERELSDQQRVVLLLKALAYQARVVVDLDALTDM
ncbi:MAG: transcription antitermination protein RfaH [Nitrospiraceae bacterium]|nr:MAG: transcription antitermination protein RfaH [Nitrospiraceae bacterium]